MNPHAPTPSDEALIRTAQGLAAQGRAEEAVSVLDPLAQRLGNPAVDMLLSRVLGAADRFDDALGALRRATERKPPYAPAFLELGVGLTDLGRLEEALSVFETGLALCPGDQNLRLGEGYLHLARGDAASAHACFTKVLAAGPDRPDALAGLAKASTLQGNHRLAADLCRRALAVRPDLIAVKMDLARILLELNQRVEAEAMLRQAGKASPPGAALSVLADASHGRLFLRPSAAARFLTS